MLSAVSLGVVALDAPRELATTPPPAVRVLVFTKTSGFRHGSIGVGGDAIEQLGIADGFAVDRTEDAATFTASQLAAYDAVVFLSTTGDVLDPEQQGAFEGYIRNGGGYVGIHSAADTEYDWAWYGGLVGAYFLSHPEPQDATLLVEDHVHESTAHLDDTWARFDEWYDFRDDPRERVHVLLSVDPSTLPDSLMTEDHPIAWCHDYDGGRAWYTALGHTDESWADPAFLQHVLGGIRTAAGVAPGRLFAEGRRRRPDVDGVDHVRRRHRRRRCRAAVPTTDRDDHDHDNDDDDDHRPRRRRCRPIRVGPGVDSTSDESVHTVGDHRGRRRCAWC